MYYQHARLRIEAELAWHQMLLGRVGKLTAGSEAACSVPRPAP